MFVLRSQELDSDSAARPANGGTRVAAKGAEAVPRERRVFVTALQARDGGGTGAQGPDAASRMAHHCGGPIQMPLFAAAFAVRFGSAMAASECPRHFGDVQALIDKVSAGVDRAHDRLRSDRAELVHALLDDARMFLEAARRNHEQPRGAYDHARAFAKADAALGHARAAQVVLSRGARE